MGIPESKMADILPPLGYFIALLKVVSKQQ